MTEMLGFQESIVEEVDEDELSPCQRLGHSTIFENGHMICFECDRGIE